MSARSDLWDNPMGTDGFEFIEYAAPDPAVMGAVFERIGFTAIARHRHKNVTLYRQGEINFILNAEPDSFAQRFARLHGPSDLRHRLPRAGRRARLRARDSSWGRGASPTRPDRRAEHPGDQGRRRLADLPGRPLARQGRREAATSATSASTTSTSSRCRAPERTAPGLGLTVHRPPDPQRPPRPHERVGRVLRAPVQLPRDPLLRHRGPGHRREEQGDDQPVRQDPHPDQRGGQREARARSRSTWTRYRGEGIQHIALGTDRYLHDGATRCAPRREAAGHHRTPTTSCSTGASPATARTSRSCSSATDPGRRQRGRAAAADLHARTSSGRSSSSSSSARATRASARATSRRSSSRSSSTRSAAACSRRPDHRPSASARGSRRPSRALRWETPSHPLALPGFSSQRGIQRFRMLHLQRQEYDTIDAEFSGIVQPTLCGQISLVMPTATGALANALRPLSVTARSSQEGQPASLALCAV